MRQLSTFNDNSDSSELTSKLKKQIRSKVESTLIKSARLTDITCHEIENQDDFLYDHWMAFILISGSSVRVMLKLHFSFQNACNMMNNKMKIISKNQISEHMAMDFMKEQCNLMAGALKSVFNNSNIITGISIPIVTRGFDESVFSDIVDQSKIKDVWKLNWSNGSVICSSVTEILHWTDFDNFIFDEDSREDDDGVFL